MIRFFSLFCGAAAVMATALPQLGHAQAPLTTQEVRGIVRSFIENNPDVILESLTRYDYEQRLKQADRMVQDHNPTFGPADAKVTIIEFSEYQCPFCAKAQPTLEKLRQRYGNNIRFVYKHLPLDFHPQAKPAALAAQAAHNQGRFWDYSNELWENQSKLGSRLYTDIAEKLGLDMKKFEFDRDAGSTKQMLAKDLADAASAGASGTPFFLINGKPFSGARPLEDFVALIEQALAEAE